MSTTLTRPNTDAVELRESISLSESVGDNALFGADGTIPVHIIRPGIGRGKGKHLYEADMLRENADKFTGWKMYVDHLSPEARKAAGGLPRSIRDLGGRITEAYWDPSVPADPERGFGQGAVVGRAKPTPFVRELIENDPEIVEASISATATGVRPVVRNGEKVWLVEGIEPKGSVDWVTEAGAGGRVAALLEALIDDEAAADGTDDDGLAVAVGVVAILESLSDDELLAYLQDQRPALVDALTANDEGAEQVSESKVVDKEAGPEDSPADKAQDATEIAKRVKELMAKGMPEPVATAIAKKEAAKVEEAAEGDSEPNDDSEGDDTGEAVGEEVEGVEPTDDPAVSDPEGEGDGSIVEALSNPEAQAMILSLVESRLNEERDTIRAEVTAEADRAVELRDLRDEAHKLIAESGMPASWQESLRAKFDLVEGVPTGGLDVADIVDDEGNVIAGAVTVLHEAVATEIASDRKKLAEASPTRVRNQGPTASKGAGEKAPTAGPSLWREVLQEAGVEDPDKAYG